MKGLRMKKYLYRFRSCNDNNFKALEAGQIWFTRADKFADASDTSFRLDIERNSQNILKVINDIGLYKMIVTLIEKQLLHYNISDVYKIMDLIIPGIEFEKNNFDIDYINNVLEFCDLKTRDSIIQIIKASIEINNIMLTNEEALKVLTRRVENDMILKINNYRKHVTICCFTETYRNLAMWESFADGFKGFCCRYDFNLYEHKEGINPLQRVIYGDKPLFDISSYYFNNEYNDKLLSVEAINQLIYKDKNMNYQKEWRIIRENDYMVDAGELIDFDICDAIIIGIYTPMKDEQKLCEIAKKIDLKVFKQCLSKYGKYYYRQLNI